MPCSITEQKHKQSARGHFVSQTGRNQQQLRLVLSQPTCTQHQDTHSSDTPSCRHPCGFANGHQQPAALAAEQRCGTGLTPTAGTRMVVKLVGMLQKPNRQGVGKQCSVCVVCVCAPPQPGTVVGLLHRRLQLQSGTFHTNGTTTRGSANQQNICRAWAMKVDKPGAAPRSTKTCAAQGGQASSLACYGSSCHVANNQWQAP